MPVINEITLYTTSQFEAGREIKGKLEKALVEVESEMEKAKQEAKAIEEEQRQLQQQQAQQGMEADRAKAAPEPPQIDQTKLIELELKKQMHQSEMQLQKEKLMLEERLANEKILSEQLREKAKQEAEDRRETVRLLKELENKPKPPTKKIANIVPNVDGSKSVEIVELELSDSGPGFEQVPIRELSRRRGQFIKNPSGIKTIVMD